MSDRPISWKGPFGRQWWENNAADAWKDLGRPEPDPSPKNPTQNDLEFDAFRHAYTHATWVRDFGEDLSRWQGDRIELDNKNNQTDKGQRDMRGDLVNNEKGREIGRDAPGNATDRQIAERVLDAIKKGDLVLDKQTDPRTLPENFPKDLNPIDKDWSDIPGDILDRWLDQLKKDIQDAWKDFTDGLDDFGKDIKDWWDRAKNWVWPRDPIILDLDGNGLETVGLAANIYFDHDGDGVLTRTGWAGKGDALLVWDRNANGSIDTGAELFGDFTPLPNGTLAPNGFAALAALDSNGDGILDASDPAFAELKLWRDADQNGVTGAGELISLLDAGIVSLNLANTLKNQNLANGNQLAREGSFTRTDGTTSAMGEFNLATDTFNTKFAEQIEVSEALKALPNMQGAGNVRELQQAAAQSDTVAGLLAQFQGAVTRAEQKALIDQLITAWADTSGMAKNLDARAQGHYIIQYEAFGNDRRADHIDSAGFIVAQTAGPLTFEGMTGALSTDIGASYLSAHYRELIDSWNQKLHALEAFNGQYFFNLPTQKSQTSNANWGMTVTTTPGSTQNSGGIAMTYSVPTLKLNFSTAQLDLLQQAYDSLSESVYASLVMQTRLKPYLDQIELVIDNDGIRLDAAALNQKLAEKKATDPENYLADLLDLDKYANSFLAGTNWTGLADFDVLIETLPQTAGKSALWLGECANEIWRIAV